MGLLLIDIGRGTQDVLLYHPETGWENSIQLILPSPTVVLAGRVDEISARGGDILLAGETMGGGPLAKAVLGHLRRGGRAWATPLAAATLDDDPGEVKSMGVEIIDEGEVGELSRHTGATVIRTGDVDLPALERAFEALGVPFAVEALAVAVQDHGRAPKGTSDRRFRFRNIRESLSRDGNLTAQAHTGEGLPGYLTRMQGVKRALGERGPLLVMDTGFAALLGALEDPAVGGGGVRLVLNVGNGHTLAGLLEGEQVIGLLELHTRGLRAESLAEWLDRLVEGSVQDEEVYRAGGHGGYLREDARFPGWKGIEVFAATGPQRAMAAALPRPPLMAAPHGQMMHTGNYGLWRAFEARREGQ